MTVQVRHPYNVPVKVPPPAFPPTLQCAEAKHCVVVSPHNALHCNAEEALGAKVLLEMFTKHNDSWIVELLYPDLFDWLDWFWRERRAGIGLMVLGSDPGFPTAPDPTVGRWGGGRDEAADNSPMYDGVGGGNPGPLVNGTGVWNKTTHRMNLYDVGSSSLVCMELQALATLAMTAFDSPRTAEHDLLMSRFTELSQLLTGYLWDEVSGLFVNRHLNGSFVRRISPTSFYPLLSGLATEHQAQQMMLKLHSPDYFCVSANGDFAGLRDDCYWGMPSIAESDPAFPALGYWRGYVWGPMIQLTYWGLQHPRYANVSEVTAGRKAMVAQAGAMELAVWRNSGHLCENYNPGKEAKCTGGTFYHWAALTGFVGLLEAGLY